MLLQIGGMNVLTDPVYSQRAGPFNIMGPKRVRQPGVAFDALPPIAIVLLVPFLYPYIAVSKLYGMERSPEEARTYSAVASD